MYDTSIQSFALINLTMNSPRVTVRRTTRATNGRSRVVATPLRTGPEQGPKIFWGRQYWNGWGARGVPQP